MYAYKRILVGLDLSDMDKTLIQYVSYLCDVFDIDKIYFFHVAKSFDLPSGILEKYPDLIAPVDETIKRQLKTHIEQYFTNDVEYTIQVREGNATEKILKWADFKEIDLVVMGKKQNLKGHGVLPGKLVKTGHCSILFVAEAAKPLISNILLPVDFSRNSKMTFEVGAKLQKRLNCTIHFQHSYQVPTGYHTSGKSFVEFSDIMREHAQHDMDQFIATGGIAKDTIEIDLTLDEDNDPTEQIMDVANGEGIDLIIIGSKGRSGIASILIGSIAEKICKIEHNIPVLIVKNKQENMSFLDAILKL